MKALAQSYFAASLQARLMIGIGAAVFLNALYCLTYRYASGNPATLFEAFSWGVVNIAPWIAAFELGRSRQRRSHLVALLLAAAALSLTLEAIIDAELPTSFDGVRRIPGALLSIAALAALGSVQKRASSNEAGSPISSKAVACDWACSAGNYVELHFLDGRTKLVRSTLERVVEGKEARLLRIHRQYAVSPRAIDRVERAHVVLIDGTRLPVGDRFRCELSQKVFAPSSQTD